MGGKGERERSPRNKSTTSRGKAKKGQMDSESSFEGFMVSNTFHTMNCNASPSGHPIYLVCCTLLHRAFAAAQNSGMGGDDGGAMGDDNVLMGTMGRTGGMGGTGTMGGGTMGRPPSPNSSMEAGKDGRKRSPRNKLSPTSRVQH